MKNWELGLKLGRVRVNKSMNEIQMQAVIKATNNFLNSKTSTRKGIKSIKKKIIDEIQKRYGSETNDISYSEAEALANFFEDLEVNKITNYIPGSDVLAVIEEAREQNNSYEQFYNQMMSIVKYNKGTDIESLLRKIYMKYIYKGNKDEIQVLYSNVIELINNIKDENEVNEIEGIIDEMAVSKQIDEKEYNYLINLLNSKRKEF